MVLKPPLSLSTQRWNLEQLFSSPKNCPFTLHLPDGFEDDVDDWLGVVEVEALPDSELEVFGPCVGLLLGGVEREDEVDEGVLLLGVEVVDSVFC